MVANRTILLVEDSDADSEATVRALGRCVGSPAVYRCADGDSALTFLRQLDRVDGLASRPAVILLDLNLPGTDGREVLEQIKADDALKHIPVVILTTSAASADVAFCYRHGASGYIVKPVDLAKFAARVQQFHAYWFEAVEPSTA
ncbi:response regulator [Limnoglobus roseus]|uniref:Response regulator n=1 Tax=Limnoglobus roseus TaxID=2598579 RepID=A0A5C1AC12_9BACT|nr:response regulator [Limnoglobus roseus]QEL15576.1 response regulator [Limnoglobus roseus]